MDMITSSEKVKILHLYEQDGQDLHKKLARLLRANFIDISHLGTVSPGLNISHELNTYAESADIVLVFLSSRFLSSPDALQREARAITLERHQAQEIHLVPILVQSVDLKELLFRA